MITEVLITTRAARSLKKVPKQVSVNFFLWEQEVSKHGLEQVRKIPGYHDEQLRGKLKNYVRSFRLGQGYRGYYSIQGDIIKFVSVEEVNKHDYKEIERLFGL
jgi:proteic killer suppression protein